MPEPASAAPNAPTNLHDDGQPIPTLSWDRVASATKYVVQGSESSSFSAHDLQRPDGQQQLHAGPCPQRRHPALAGAGCRRHRVQRLCRGPGHRGRPGAAHRPDRHAEHGLHDPPAGGASGRPVGRRPGCDELRRRGRRRGRRRRRHREDRHQDHDVRLARPAGRGRADPPRELLRAGARASSTTTSRPTGRTTSSYDVNQLDPVTSASCDPGADLRPHPRQPTDRPADRARCRTSSSTGTRSRAPSSTRSGSR